MRALSAWRCRRFGHIWWSVPQSEFVVVTQLCWRCGVTQAVKPWGQCLGGHPIADHYDDDGNEVQIEACGFPR